MESTKKKTIIYLHSFGSSGQSGTVKHMRKVMPQFNVLAPDIPIRPRIDNLLEVLHKKDAHIYSDVAIGVLPLDKEEMIKYIRNIDILK